MHTVYLSLGSNLNNRYRNITNALFLMERRIGIGLVHLSSLYETQPQDIQSDKLFYNIIVQANTSLEPHDLLKTLLAIEKELGRERPESGIKGDRVIDIDLLLFDDYIIDTPELVLPHPLMHTRPFVLIPLNEIAPDIVHPVLNKTSRQMLDEIYNESPYSLDVRRL